MSYFRNFPKTLYNQNFKVNSKSLELVTNIFFRARFQEIIKNEKVPYYLYTVRDHDTPESVAEKYYGDPEAHWVVLLANDMIDPYYDWPLSDKNFKEYIKEKYGSIANAQSTIHHYEMQIKTTDSFTTLETTRNFQIDATDARTANTDTFPYTAYDELAVDYYPNVDGTFADGSAVTIVVSRDTVSEYDYEDALNEEKRHIRLIRKDFYPSVVKQFENLLGKTRPIYTRNIGGY